MAVRRLALIAVMGSLAIHQASNGNPTADYGVSMRPASKAYLEMPETERGPFPARLSQTGAFKSVVDLSPAESLIPYDINVAFYSDGAAKMRWISVPPGRSSKIRFNPTGEWQFPNGTVFVKHFE